jgi:Xaa-Pro aminopeptidase
VTLAEHERQPDMKRLRAYRLARVQDELRKHDYAGGFFCDPSNVRYATGTRNMSVWTSHVPARYCFVPAQGKTILFEFRSSQHLANGIETVGECRPFIGWYYMTTGTRQMEKAKAFAATVAAVVREHGGGKNHRVAFDRLDPLGLDLVRAEGIDVFEGEEVMQHARSVKSEDEIAGMTHSLAVCDAGIARMREALRPDSRRTSCGRFCTRRTSATAANASRRGSSPRAAARTPGSRSAATASSVPAISSRSTPT